MAILIIPQSSFAIRHSPLTPVGSRVAFSSDGPDTPTTDAPDRLCARPAGRGRLLLRLVAGGTRARPALRPAGSRPAEGLPTEILRRRRLRRARGVHRDPDPGR